MAVDRELHRKATDAGVSDAALALWLGVSEQTLRRYRAPDEAEAAKIGRQLDKFRDGWTVLARGEKGFEWLPGPGPDTAELFQAAVAALGDYRERIVEELERREAAVRAREEAAEKAAALLGTAGRALAALPIGPSPRPAPRVPDPMTGRYPYPNRASDDSDTNLGELVREADRLHTERRAVREVDAGGGMGAVVGDGGGLRAESQPATGDSRKSAYRGLTGVRPPGKLLAMNLLDSIPLRQKRDTSPLGEAKSVDVTLYKCDLEYLDAIVAQKKASRTALIRDLIAKVIQEKKEGGAMT